MFARWATKGEILEHTTKITKESEVLKSGITYMYDDEAVYINNSETHNLVIGGSGSGKTQTTIMPQIYLSIRASESFIVNDHAGELYNTFSGMASENGYKVQVINFRDMGVGNNYNPLYIPYKLYKEGNTDEAIELIENVGYNLISDFNQTDVDPFWENQSINLFTGLALYLFRKANIEEININSIINLSYRIDEIKEELKDADKSSDIYIILSSIFDAPNETRGSIISVFRQKLAIMSRESLSKLLANNNLDLENIKKEKTAIFIISDSKYSSIVLPMILNQAYSIVKSNPKTEKRLNSNNGRSCIDLKNIHKN